MLNVCRSKDIFTFDFLFSSRWLLEDTFVVTTFVLIEEK